MIVTKKETDHRKYERQIKAEKTGNIPDPINTFSDSYSKDVYRHTLSLLKTATNLFVMHRRITTSHMVCFFLHYICAFIHVHSQQ